jgi:protease-4
MMRSTCLTGAALLAAVSLTACSPKIQIGIGADDYILKETLVFSDTAPANNKIVMIDVRGMITDSARSGLLGPGANPVDRFVAELNLAERDKSVKAVIVRISSPGGTVTGSDIMYTELRRFAEQSKKPIVASMGEVAASGGYYLAIGADHIVAQPTTITGSIGVIMPTINFSSGLNRIGIESRAIKSGPNKDMANPLEPMRDSQYAVLQAMVDDFYARFKGLVVERRRNLTADNVAMATDGRVFTGMQAEKLGLVDELGGVRESFAAAKRLAGIPGASLIKYGDPSRPARTAYADSSLPPASHAGTEVNVLKLDLNHPGAVTDTSGFYYLWQPMIGPTNP